LPSSSPPSRQWQSPREPRRAATANGGDGDSDGADARPPARCPRALAALAPLLPPLTRVDLLARVKLKLRLARVDDATVGLERVSDCGLRAMLVDIETALALR